LAHLVWFNLVQQNFFGTFEFAVLNRTFGFANVILRFGFLQFPVGLLDIIKEQRNNFYNILYPR